MAQERLLERDIGERDRGVLLRPGEAAARLGAGLRLRLGFRLGLRLGE